LGGLILDNIVVFLFRSIVRLIKEHRSNAWAVAEGRVVKAYAPGSSQYPTVEVAYTYTVEGKLYTGLSTRAFWLVSSAEEYARQFEPGNRLVVRYKPGDPMASVVPLNG